MQTHSFIHYYSTICSIIRGFLLNVLFFRLKAHNLRVQQGFSFTGKLALGAGVKIGKNVRIFRKCKIGNKVIIGDNVELRCNGEPNMIIIEDYCTVNRNTIIGGMVSIGKYSMIAPGCVIIGSNHNFNDPAILIKKQGIISKGITIEDNVWVGANVSIVDGVYVGTGCVIGAGSIVTKNIPPYSVAVGNPAKVIKNRK